MRNAIALILLSSIMLGCGEEPPPAPPPMKEFRLEVSATEDINPLPLVPVFVDGKVVGYTDKSGRFEATLKDRPGRSITLGIGEHDGYRLTSDSEVTETLRLTNAGIGVPVALNATFESLRREYMVWVSTGCDPKAIDPSFCEGLAILMDGEEIGRTDDLGQAHITFTQVPQRDVKFTIQTPKANPLEADIIPLPEDPTFEIKLDFTSQIYLIEENFINAIQARKPEKRTVRKTSNRPIRRVAPKPKPKPKPKADPKAKGEIDLW